MRDFISLLIWILIVFWHSALASQDIDSLEQLLQDARSDSVRASLLYRIAKNGFNSDPERSLRYASESAEIARNRGDSALWAMSMQIAGVVYKNRGDYTRALEQQLRAVRIIEKLGNKKLLASSYNDLGVLNKNLGNWDLAIGYYRSSLAIIEELGNKRISALLLNNIGTIYDAKNRPDSAEYYYTLSLEISSETGDPEGMALSLNNLGELHASEGDHRKALDCFTRTLEIDQETGNRMGEIYSCLNMAGAYLELADLKRALEYFDRAEELSLEMDAASLLSQAYRGKSSVFRRMGNFRNALDYLEKHKSIQDSLMNERKSEQIAEMQARFESEKNEAEIELLKKEQRINGLLIAKQKNHILVLILGIAMVAGLGVFLVYRTRQRHQAIMQKEIIRQKELGLRAVFEAQEEERKRIAKDLHDGIGQTLSGLRLAWEALTRQLSGISEAERNRMHELTAVIDGACQDVRTISHQMMPRQLSELGLIPALEDMLVKSFGNTGINYRFEHFGIDGRFSENVEIALYRIAQELVNNVIKHSGATRVSFQVLRNRNFLVMIVEDNGRGFNYGEKQGSGIGLLNIASRIGTVNGEINYEPSPGSGTVATIRVPVA
ncbi:MAG: sensor histidine kinase [Bacteroidales bacterium]|nr:sensor histidine kinase [Bacteroidales bacterium]